MLQHEYLLGDIGFDTAENEPSTIWQLSKQQSAEVLFAKTLVPHFGWTEWTAEALFYQRPNLHAWFMLMQYERAAEVSAVNYSFFMGASNDNLDEVLKTDPRKVCGVKVFMGSSTGNMLVDNRAVLESLRA